MGVRAKELRYAVDLGAGEVARDEDGAALTVPEGWTPEHLLLAALVRCTVKSLRYHAARGQVRVEDASGSARGLVTKREDDGRYGLVEVAVELSVRLEPEPGPEELAELLAKAERDCFVGASLRVSPSYRWLVRGVPVGA